MTAKKNEREPERRDADRGAIADDIVIGVEPSPVDARPGADLSDADLIRAKNLHGDDGGSFTRQFVVPKDQFVTGFDHSPNFTGAAQDVVNVGLRPTGDVAYIGSEDHPDGESVILTYTVPVLLASDEKAPSVVVDAQEVLRDGITAADERTPVDPDQVAPRTGDAKFSGYGDEPEHQLEGKRDSR